MDEGRGKLRVLVEVLVTLGALWVSLPEHQRREFMMRMVTKSQRLTERAARRFGRVGIRDELRGNEAAAQVSYEAAYKLMTGPRERLSKLYDKLRGAIS